LPFDLGISMDVGGAALGVEVGSTGAAAAGVVVEGVEDCLGSSLTRAFAAFFTLSFIAIFVSVYKGDGRWLKGERNVDDKLEGRRVRGWVD
jgi:hypothetical protein